MAAPPSHFGSELSGSLAAPRRERSRIRRHPPPCVAAERGPESRRWWLRRLPSPCHIRPARRSSRRGARHDGRLDRDLRDHRRADRRDRRFLARPHPSREGRREAASPAAGRDQLPLPAVARLRGPALADRLALGLYEADRLPDGLRHREARRLLRRNGGSGQGRRSCWRTRSRICATSSTRWRPRATCRRRCGSCGRNSMPCPRARRMFRIRRRLRRRRPRWKPSSSESTGSSYG